MIDSVSLWVNLSTCDVIFLHLLSQCLAIHTHHIAIDQATLVEFVQDTHNTTSTVALLYTILLSIRSQLAEARHLTAQLVDVLHLEVGTSLLSHSQEMKYRIGTSTHSDV